MASTDHVSLSLSFVLGGDSWSCEWKTLARRKLFAAADQPLNVMLKTCSSLRRMPSLVNEDKVSAKEVKFAVRECRESGSLRQTLLTNRQPMRALGSHPGALGSDEPKRGRRRPKALPRRLDAAALHPASVFF